MAEDNTLVLWACKNDKPNVLQECIKMQYDLNQCDGFGTTPLMHVCIQNNFNMVQILCENSVDLNLINSNNKTAMDYAESKSIYDYLQSRGAKIADTNSSTQENKMTYLMGCIHYQYEASRVKYIEYAIQRCGKNPNKLDQNGNSALCYFRSTTYLESLDCLIRNGAAVDHHGKNGKTPLMLSVLRDFFTIFQYFLHRNANVNFIDSDGNSVLAYAALNGNITIAKLLLSQGADINGFGSNGKLPLSWAVINGKCEMVEFLLKNGANANLKDFKGQTPLDYAKKYKQTTIINLLGKNSAVRKNQQSSAAINKTSTNQNNIFTAIKSNNFQIVKQLLTNNKLIYYEKNESNQTPLDVAIKAENLDVIQLLLENKNDSNYMLNSALPTAIRTKNVEIIKILLENGVNVNKIYKKTKQSPLLQAVCEKNKEIIDLLLEYGANSGEEETSTLIQKILEWNNIEVLVHLIERNQIEANSLLKMSVEHKNVMLIIILLKNGANPTNFVDQLTQLAEEDDGLDAELSNAIRNNSRRRQEVQKVNKAEVNAAVTNKKEAL